MCGIAGIIHFDGAPVPEGLVEEMCKTLRHRGPDDHGVVYLPMSASPNGGVAAALGNQRLSIIDVAGGHQPIGNEDGTIWASFNGEIYNFRELRRELEAQGAKFRTDGDSETILAAWQRWGPDCLIRLEGMFAFALYDCDRRQLFLARDRLGVKPLFTATLSDGSLIFASELKGLLAHPLMRSQVDPLAIEDYMTWGYVPDHRSILRGVEKLPAGHFRLLDHDRPPAPPPQPAWR